MYADVCGFYHDPLRSPITILSALKTPAYSSLTLTLAPDTRRPRFVMTLRHYTRALPFITVIWSPYRLRPDVLVLLLIIIWSSDTFELLFLMIIMLLIHVLCSSERIIHTGRSINVCHALYVSVCSTTP